MRRFYRAQSDQPYTYYEEGEGLEAKGHYWTMPRYWVRNGEVERHLNWKTVLMNTPPFISVFDDMLKAIERAWDPIARGHTGVFVAETTLPIPQDTTLTIENHLGNVVDLPILQNIDDETGTTTFVGTEAFRRH
ncbi:hypothetical protein DL769_007738 [Monosporascus sp. CRB-8-3]|nr:hypothetical protein DL769_007738 [Monosporascus sp. CRB-8-3]